VAFSAGDGKKADGKICHMAKVTKIHQSKSPVRRHFIAEWMEARGMSASDLVEALNDPDRFSELGYIDKSQVYRWLKGQMPQAAHQARIAAALGHEDDPSIILRAPEADWLARFFEDRSREELERMKTMLEAAFPRKTGSGG
jgi:transcriptional regulator with XRE-family HTH domain